jgi:hypothetical protein
MLSDVNKACGQYRRLTDEIKKTKSDVQKMSKSSETVLKNVQVAHFENTDTFSSLCFKRKTTNSGKSVAFSKILCRYS